MSRPASPTSFSPLCRYVPITSSFAAALRRYSWPPHLLKIDAISRPNGTGVAKGVSLPDNWSQKDYLWDVKLPGSGYGSMFLPRKHLPDDRRKRFSTTRGSSPGTQRRQSCLATRVPRGQTCSARSQQLRFFRHPCCDDDAVYAVWSDHVNTFAVALDHQGKELWKVDLGSWVGQHGYAISPMRVDMTCW